MKKILSAAMLSTLSILAAGTASATTWTGTITRVFVTPTITYIDVLSGGNTYVLAIDDTVTAAEMVGPMVNLAIQAWSDGASVDVTNDTGACLGYCVLLIETN